MANITVMPNHLNIADKFSISDNFYVDADVSADAWFASFANYSKQKNIFPLTGNLFEGAKGVTRAEVAETLYRLIVLQETNAARYLDDLEIES